MLAEWFRGITDYASAAFTGSIEAMFKFQLLTWITTIIEPVEGREMTIRYRHRLSADNHPTASKMGFLISRTGFEKEALNRATSGMYSYTVVLLAHLLKWHYQPLG